MSYFLRFDNNSFILLQKPKAGFARDPKDTFSHHREHRAHREKTDCPAGKSLKVLG